MGAVSFFDSAGAWRMDPVPSNLVSREQYIALFVGNGG